MVGRLRSQVAFVALLSLASVASANNDHALPSIVASIGVDSRSDAGAASAGTLCFPSGRLRVQDFAPDDIAVETAILKALKSSGSTEEFKSLYGDGVNLRIELTRITAKLCNRSYGILGTGDRKSFSGTVAMTFNWEVRRLTEESIIGISVVSLNVHRKEPTTLSNVFYHSSRELLGRISDQLSSNPEPIRTAQ